MVINAKPEASGTVVRTVVAAPGPTVVGSVSIDITGSHITKGKPAGKHFTGHCLKAGLVHCATVSCLWQAFSAEIMAHVADGTRHGNTRWVCRPVMNIRGSINSEGSCD